MAKKFEKLKQTIMASFQAKIGRKRLRKRENKNYRSLPTRRVREKSKKIQYVKKYDYGVISSQNRLEKAEKR